MVHVPPIYLVQGKIARNPIKPESGLIVRHSIHTGTVQTEKTLLCDFLGSSAPSDQALEKAAQSRVHCVEDLGESILISLHI